MRLNRATAASQANSREALANAVGRKNHFVPIFKEGALFSARKFQRLGPSPSALEQAASILFVRPRYRPTRDQITRAQRAAIGRMVRDHLR
jgi:hypothetical protein